MKKTNGKKNQRGVALLFSLGMLGLMMVLALTFASVSMTDAEIGGNEIAKVSARALARTAVNRALFQLKNSQTIQSTGTSGSNVYLTGNLRTDEIVSGNNTALIASGVANNNQRDFDYLWKAVPDRAFTSTERVQLSAGMDTGYHTDFMNAMRYRLLCKYGQTPGLEKYFDPAKDTKDSNSLLTTDSTFATLYKSADANLRTTPFWEYVRNPATNAIIGRFAYLAYRPHGLLDWTAYADVDNDKYKYRRLGLFPEELSLESLNDSTISVPEENATYSVWGRWKNSKKETDDTGNSYKDQLLNRYLRFEGRSDMKKFNVGSDMLRYLFDVGKRSSASIGTVDNPDGTPDATVYPTNEIAFNNLLGKWLKLSPQYDAQSFWYKDGSSDPKRYLRFNLNRTYEEWNDLTVFQLTNLANLTEYQLTNQLADTTGVQLGTPLSANATKCIPLFSLDSTATPDPDKTIRYQVTSNFLAWFADPHPSSEAAEDQRKRTIQKGFWGKVNTADDTFENNTYSAEKELKICDDPDWTANMRTPYIKEAVLKVEFSMSLNNKGYESFVTPLPEEKCIYHYPEVNATVRITPFLYVTVVDFFSSAASDKYENLKIRLKGANDPTKLPKIQFNLSNSSFKYQLKNDASPQALPAASSVSNLTYTPHFALYGSTCKDPSKGSATEKLQLFYDRTNSSDPPGKLAPVTTSEILNHNFYSYEIDSTDGKTLKKVARSLPYRLKTYRIDLPVDDLNASEDPEISIAYDNAATKTFTINLGGKAGSEAAAENQTKITLICNQISASVENLAVGIYSSDGVPLDFAKVQSSSVSLDPMGQASAFPMQVTLEVKDEGGAQSDVVPVPVTGCSFYADFQAKDVRSNLNANDWGLHPISDSTDAALLTRIQTTLNDSSISAGNAGDSTDNYSGPTLSSYIRPPLPATPSTTDYSLYPFPHPWEIGMISRGEPFKTLNLKNFDKNQIDNLTNCMLFCGKDSMTASSYTKGDANILDQVMVSHIPASQSTKLELRDQLGRIDVNAISFLNEPDSGLFVSGSAHDKRYQYPNRGNLFAARILFGSKLSLCFDPLGTTVANSYFGKGYSSTGSLLAGDWYFNGPAGTSIPKISQKTIKDVLEGIAEYNKLLTDLYTDPVATATNWTDLCKAIRRNMFHSRAELISGEDKLDTTDIPASYHQPLKTALNKIRYALLGSTTSSSSAPPEAYPDAFPDSAKEELFSKLVMLLEAGDGTTAQPDRDLIVLGIAQSIRDSSRTAVPLDLTGDGTYATPSLAANDARVKNGSAYKNFAGIFYDFSDFHSSSTYPSVFNAFGSKSQFSSGMVLGGTTGLTGMNSTGLGYYQPGFDKILSTQKILGWFRKDDSGKWKIIRTDYVE